MNQDDKKKAAAVAALEFVEDDCFVGVGTGSTANHFIDGLASIAPRVRGAVASSLATARRLEGHGIRVVELDVAGTLPLYVDGADEATEFRYLIKGGGGALTREKIVAQASDLFVCVCDDTKLVARLGEFPLPLEVIPMAVAPVSRELVSLGGDPVLREGFTTDNGNAILDVKGLSIEDPPLLESALNQIPGVVTNGLFALRPADLLLIGGDDGVKRI